MNWIAECIAVIPCLNEERMVGDVVRGVREHVERVIVVDDGSSDRTSEAAQRAGAEVIRHHAPRGKGAALRSGWQTAAERGCGWVLMLDGDGQHLPSDIPRFFERAERTGAALVVGNRMHSASSIPPLRRFVNRWMSRRLSAVAGMELPDSQCGFRLVRTEALTAVPLTTDNFETESEQLVAFARAGKRIEFAPVSVIYRKEQSKIHPLRDTLRWFRWLRKARRSFGRQE